MAIAGTVKKLDQVDYYLKLMEEAALARPVDARAFEHALSGLLQAGRNVTFALEKEAPSEKEVWFRGWCAALSSADQELLRQMNLQRVADVHRAGAVTTSSITTPLSTVFPQATPSIPGTIMMGSSSSPNAVHYFTDGPTPQEALPRCRAYAALVRRLVGDFLAAHPDHR